MKKANWHEILATVLRLVVRFAVGTAVVLIALYVFFKDTDVFDFLFSSEETAVVILFFIVTLLFGFIEGVLIFVVEFVNALAKKDMMLEDAQKEINDLRETLGKIDKRYAKSPASRMFDQIKDVGAGNKSIPKTSNFQTLQEELKSNNRNHSEDKE